MLPSNKSSINLPNLSSSLQEIDRKAIKKKKSSVKEKRRNDELNTAFKNLQAKLPHIPRHGRLPKIKTLRIAHRYIQHLNAVLEGRMIDHFTYVRPLSIDDFANVAEEEIQTKNRYTERADEELKRCSGINSSDGSSEQDMDSEDVDDVESPESDDVNEIPNHTTSNDDYSNLYQNYQSIQLPYTSQLYLQMQAYPFSDISYFEEPKLNF
ncbi:hypothetical protein WR25_08246 [Diploscapter pachys]|uniref:BHLH domain-containing protein n=1 Tax=Diploscapter pachys TaxID=2018661 RepID=A0A2A2LHF8_9BILA|nr:hypothetical protein WR25_08246 [Diploscapter pachys]